MASGTPQRVDIQGFRALAVLLVLADHLGVSFLAGGYVGVDVFFVLSGFLISSLLFAEVGSTARVSITSFYARRARRILPAATVVLAVVLGFTALTMSLARVRDTAGDALWAAFFLANVHFAGQGQDYFADTAGVSPVQHFWSLAVEEQFYLVWPALLAVLALWWRRRRRGSVGEPAAAGRGAWWTRPVVGVVAGVVVLASVLSFAWSVLLTGRDQQAAYFSTPARAWELAAGALLALAVPALARLTTPVRVGLSTVGLVAVAVAAVLYSPQTPFPGWQAALPVGGTVALLAAGTGADHPWPGRLLTIRPAPWFGDISYSLYLWHWPVIILGKAQFPDLTAGRRGTLLLIAVSVLLAWLSYTLVEEPFRRGRVPALSRGRTALLLWPVACGCVVLSAAAAPGFTQHRIDRAHEVSRAYYAHEGRSAPAAAGLGSVADVRQALRQEVRLARAGAPLPPHLVNLDRLNRDLWQFRYRCAADWSDTRVPICPVGDASADRTVVVYGDSHAGVWLPALDRLGRERGFRVVPLVKFGCVPFDVAQLEHGTPFPECERFRTWAEHEIVRLDPDLVLTSYRALLSQVKVPGQTAQQTWRAGVRTAMPRLARLGKVVVMSDYSVAPFRPQDCLTDPGNRLADCTFSVQPAATEGNAAVRQAAAHADVPYVDVSRLVCVEGRCPTVVGDVAAFRDGAHLSVTWVDRLAPAIGDLLGRYLPHR